MKTFIIIVIALGVGIGVLNYWLSRKGAPAQQNLPPTQTMIPQPTTPTTTPTTTPVKTYTMADVEAHGALGDSDECWTVIHGKVYDITEFAATSHPGGELIYQACGSDATKLFETRPQGSGTPHSENARKILEQYYIGDLKQ